MSDKKFSAEELKGKAKGALGYLKHLAKDPITTLPEAKARLKEILIFTGICAAIMLVPSIIAAAINVDILMTIASVFSIVGGIGFFYGIFLLFVLGKISGVMKIRECTKCKEQITYGDNIRYEILRKWKDKQVNTNNSGSTNVRETIKAEVKLYCTCQNCKTLKEFKYEFRLEEYYNGSLRYSYELDKLVEGFFTGEHVQ